MEHASEEGSLRKYFRVFDLPQELQDIIFNYASAKLTEAELIRTRPQRTHHSRSAMVSPQGEHSVRNAKIKVNEWLISKKWFVTAAKVYLESQVVSVKTVGYGKSRCRVLEAMSSNLYTSSIDSHYFQAERYPKMRSLHLQLSPPFDWREEAHPEDIVVLSDDQIMEMEVFQDLKAVSGLRKWQVSSDNEHRQETPEEMAVIEVNLKRVEELAWPFVSREKDPVAYELDEEGLPRLGYYYRERVEALVEDAAMDLLLAAPDGAKASRAEEAEEETAAEVGSLTKQLSKFSFV